MDDILTIITEDLPNNNNCSIYPNPSTGLINIVAGSNRMTVTDVKVYNISGKLLIHETVDLLANEQQQINLSSFQSGMYLIQLIGMNSVESKRIVIN